MAFTKIHRIQSSITYIKMSQICRYRLSSVIVNRLRLTWNGSYMYLGVVDRIVVRTIYHLTKSYQSITVLSVPLYDQQHLDTYIYMSILFILLLFLFFSILFFSFLSLLTKDGITSRNVK